MSTPSADKTRWGILGTARIATKVARAIDLAPNAELIAIASRDHHRAASWAATRDLERSYASYDALLEDPEIDAVYIPLPPSLHREWTIKAAEKSKHVLCEKPLALTTTEVDQIEQAAQRNGVVIQEAAMMRYRPQTEYVRQLVNDNVIFYKNIFIH